LDVLAEFATCADLSMLMARWIITDCIPVIATGMQQPEMKALVAKHLAQAGAGNVWVVGTADRLRATEAIELRWQHGDGRDVAQRGLEFTVPPVDVLAFHGSLDNPQLVLFASGNYFFALGQAVEEFGRAHPRYRGHVFYETLPPGLLLKQMEAGGTVTSGNMT
jgi:hypothetical protein